MKKSVLFACAAVAALMIGGVAAEAATIDINAGAVISNQVSNDHVRQFAGAADVAFGEVDDHSSISATAANLNNALTADINVENLQATTYGGELGLAAIRQVSNEDVSQGAVALAGSGSVEDHSSAAAAAVNANNLANVTINVH